MFNKAFVFRSSTFIFLFLYKRFLYFFFFFCCYIASSHSGLLCCYKGVWNVSYRIESMYVFSSWVYSFTLFCSCFLHPTIGLTNGDTLKSFLKMTWPIFHLVSPQQTCYDTAALSLCCFCSGSQFCDPDRHFAFIVAPSNLVSATFFFCCCFRLCASPFALVPTHETGQEKWRLPVSVLNCMVIALRKGHTVQMCF